MGGCLAKGHFSHGCRNFRPKCPSFGLEPSPLTFMSWLPRKHTFWSLLMISDVISSHHSAFTWFKQNIVLWVLDILRLNLPPLLSFTLSEPPAKVPGLCKRNWWSTRWRDYGWELVLRSGLPLRALLILLTSLYSTAVHFVPGPYAGINSAGVISPT